MGLSALAGWAKEPNAAVRTNLGKCRLGNYTFGKLPLRKISLGSCRSLKKIIFPFIDLIIVESISENQNRPDNVSKIVTKRILENAVLTASLPIYLEIKVLLLNSMFETQPGNPENMVELNQNETKVNKLRQKSIESIIVMTDISRKNKGKTIS